MDVALATNEETGEFSILIAVLEAANPSIINRLSSERQSTVFAPTDAAPEGLAGRSSLTA